MQIRTYEEVDPREVFRLTMLTFGWRLTPDLVRHFLRRDPATVPGYSFYAVEAGHVMAQAVPMLMNVRLTTGVEQVGGVAGVGAPGQRVGSLRAPQARPPRAAPHGDGGKPGRGPAQSVGDQPRQPGMGAQRFADQVRAAGRGLKCCMVQFMKSKTDRYGEHESLEKLGIEVHTMGAGFTWDTKDRELDVTTSRETWQLCVAKLRSAEYELLVFDEIVYVLDYGFLDLIEVLTEIKTVREKQPHLHIVMSGRNAPQELIDAADLVTEMTEVKHPFQAGIRAQKGIEF